MYDGFFCIEIVLHQKIVYGIVQISLRYSNSAGCISLRVYVQHEYFLAFQSEAGAQIDVGSRLANAALLIKYRYRFSQFATSRYVINLLRLLYNTVTFFATVL